MKRLVYILLLVSLIPYNFQAQDYEPFPTDSIAWLYLTTVWDNQGNTEIGDVYFYYLSGDTTINSQEYSFLYRAPTNEFIDNQFHHYNPSSNYFIGLWKEQNKRVSLHPQLNLTEEFLLYDFNLNLGDTITWEGHQITGSTEEITSIYSFNSEVILANGETRNQHEYNQVNAVIIEGIGSILGDLIAPGIFVNFSTDLVCASKPNELLFSQEIFGANLNSSFNCLNVVTDLTEIKSKRINLYPNPSSDKVYFEIPFGQNVEVNVYDNLGRKTQVPIVINGDQYSLDIKGIPTGLYTIHIQSNDQQNFVGKFIKAQKIN